VQVASRDCHWQSDVRTVHVMLPAQGRIAHTTNAQMGTNPLPLALPPDEFRYVVHNLPAEVSFNWEAGTLGNTVAYQFVLQDTNGKELVRRMTNERLLRLKINRPGDYRWQVEGIPQPSNRGPVGSKVYSETRQFHLQSAADLVAKPIFNVFDDMLASGKSTLVYAEEGF
jgi:hypothetical protein